MKTIGNIHKKLWHYTNKEKAINILDNNQLWATDFNHLNDSQEIKITSTFLTKYFEKRVHEINLLRIKKKQISPQELAHKLLSVTQETSTGIYLFSFCGHQSTGDKDDEDKDAKYIAKNGLLSQWRAYGKEEGICLVFNTLELEKAFKDEGSKFDSFQFNFLDVLYWYPEDENVEKILPILEDIRLKNNKPVLRVFDAFLDQHPSMDENLRIELPEAYSLILGRLKHKGFKEEQEVRVVCVPLREGKMPLTKPQLPSYDDQGDGKWRIKFFKDRKKFKLPVEEIIIAPSTKQDEVECEMKKACKELGLEIPIRCSETPFLQQSDKQPNANNNPPSPQP